MAEIKGAGGVAYRKVGSSYFEQRGFRRYAGVWSLWALGVGAVISGHYSGWNLGLGTGGWGGMVLAGIIIMIMYLGLVFCIAEMAPALPHTGAAYSFARSAMGLGAAHHRTMRECRVRSHARRDRLLYRRLHGGHF
jgi:ethanolamine permease